MVDNKNHEENEVQNEKRQLNHKLDYLGDSIIELAKQIKIHINRANEYNFTHTAVALENVLHTVLMCEKSLNQDLADNKENLIKKDIIIS